MGAVLGIPVPGWLFWCQLEVTAPRASVNMVHCEWQFSRNGFVLPSATSALGNSVFQHCGGEQPVSSNFSSHSNAEISSLKPWDAFSNSQDLLEYYFLSKDCHVNLSVKTGFFHVNSLCSIQSRHRKELFKLVLFHLFLNCWVCPSSWTTSSLYFMCSITQAFQFHQCSVSQNFDILEAPSLLPGGSADVHIHLPMGIACSLSNTWPLS